MKENIKSIIRKDIKKYRKLSEYSEDEENKEIFQNIVFYLENQIKGGE